MKCDSNITLDIGGEGRHAAAWNLNPSRVKTVGPHKGEPIPRLILGRGNAIPFPDRSVARIIVERTPLRTAALIEMARVITPSGLIILRHVRSPFSDPHLTAKSILPGRIVVRAPQSFGRFIQETRFHQS